MNLVRATMGFLYPFIVASLWTHGWEIFHEIIPAEGRKKVKEQISS